MNYDATASYYDIFAAGHGVAALPSVSFFAGLVPPGETVLDIGAGSGRVALAAARLAGHVWCLEPSPVMRAALLAKLAQHRDLWPRVTVLAGAAPCFSLPVLAGYAYLAGVMQYIPAADRPALFATLARHLRPGAVLALDMIGGEPASFPARTVSSVTIGRCGYALSAAAEVTGPGEQLLVLDYQTALDDQPVDRQQVRRARYFHTAAAAAADLAAAGFTVTGGSALGPASAEPADGGTLTATLEP